jgi:predicted DNA binding CopG/RHH family protein
MKAKAKPMPSLRSDEEAEQFVETADLSLYDLSGFKPAHFEFEPKSATMTMRLPQPLLDAVKLKAKAKGIPYTRYVRLLLENDTASMDVRGGSGGRKGPA